MKQVFKLAPLALAVAAVSFSGFAVAEDDADLTKTVTINKNVDYSGNVSITGTIRVNSLGMAVINDEQDSDDNRVINGQVDNNALMDEDAMHDAKGNLGVNISAGDNNVQGNSAALAAADALFIFGSGDAEIFSDQNADDNTTRNLGVINNADMTGNALRNARGNVGVNIAAGNSNVQKNAFAGAVASGSMGEASVSSKQETENNFTDNQAEITQEVLTTNFRVGGRLNGRYAGGGRGSYETVGGQYTGTSEQDGGTYPEIWIDDGTHGNGDGFVIGHLDFDDENADADGTFSFTESGSITPNQRRGDLRFREAGRQTLAGVMRGSADYVVDRYIRHENNATFDGNALRGARGNIGVNITAGTNNLQNNSLSMSQVNAPGLPSGPQGETPNP